MKTKSIIAALFLSLGLMAQNKPSIAVLNIESKGIVNTAQETGYLVRLELEKTGVYNVLDKYEVNEILTQQKIEINNCYSKTCLTEAGKALKADKMMAGSVERLGEKIVVSLRIIDVASGNVEKSDATEYLNLPEIQKMIGISVKKIAGIEPDPVMTKLLIDYEVPIESPKNTLRLNGPRMGFASTIGNAYPILTGTNTSKGEFGMFPVTFQFGWQQEYQYISSGNFQALVEGIVMFSGLESSRFIPSLTPMMGFRFGKGAWEFGFGPNFRLVKMASGFYDTNNHLGNGKDAWYLNKEWNGKDSTGAPMINPYDSQRRLDSRGDITLSAGLVIAVGKTFRSGYLNIPVNVYVMPKREGTTIGATVGFNIQKKKKVE